MPVRTVHGKRIPNVRRVACRSSISAVDVGRSTGDHTKFTLNTIVTTRFATKGGNFLKVSSVLGFWLVARAGRRIFRRAVSWVRRDDHSLPTFRTLSTRYLIIIKPSYPYQCFSSQMCPLKDLRACRRSTNARYIKVNK